MPKLKRFSTSSRRRDLNRLAINVPSRWRMASIAPDDALILPHRANPHGWDFRERQVQYHENRRVRRSIVSLSETYVLKYWCSRKGNGGKLILGFRVWASRNRNNYFQKAQVQSDPCRCLLLAQVPMLSAFQNSERACGVNLHTERARFSTLNQWDRPRGRGAGPRSPTPDWTEANDRLAKYKAVGAAFPACAQAGSASV
jgi:hypothetical protein